MYEAAKVRAKQPEAKVPNLIVNLAEQVLSRVGACVYAAGAIEGRPNQFLVRGIAANHFVQNCYVHFVQRFAHLDEITKPVLRALL